MKNKSFKTIKKKFFESPKCKNNIKHIQLDINKILSLVSRHSPPIFVTQRSVVIDQLDKLSKSLQKAWPKYQIAYSFKTNYKLAKDKLLRKKEVWAEVVSGKEYMMAKNLGYQGDQIIFNGPYKKNSELIQAFKDRAKINVDNFSELNKIKKINTKEKKGLGLRLNIKLKKVNKSRFGFSIDSQEACKALRLIKNTPSLYLDGLHIHLGSDVENPIFYHQTAKKVAKFITKKIPHYKKTLKYIDFGGGFPEANEKPYEKKTWNPHPINCYINNITSPLKKIFPLDKKPLLILEPGRFLIDKAVFCICEIIDVKQEKKQQKLIVNISITMLPLAYYRPQIIKYYSKKPNLINKTLVDTTICGSSCKEDDILYQGPQPKVEVGDYIVFFNVGAYNQNMGSNFIFNQPKTVFV